MTQLPSKSTDRTSTRHRSRAWLLLLIAPYIALCFPQMYNRLTPALWGFPFFYWYQFAWVLITSAILAIVYKKVAKQPSPDK